MTYVLNIILNSYSLPRFPPNVFFLVFSMQVESSERLARNLSIGNAENSEMLSIANKTEKTEKKGEVKVGDDISSAASSDSEDGFVEANEMSGSEVKRAAEVGSGDHV